MEYITLSLLQCILLGGWYWCSTTHSIGIIQDAYFGVMGAGFVSGLILGDMPTCMITAAAIQPLFLAFVGAGGTVVWDEAAATIICCVMVKTGGLNVEQAAVVALPISILFAQLQVLKRVLFGYLGDAADRFAQKGNGKGVVFCATWATLIAKFFMFWIPMSLILYLGTDFANTLVSAMPEWLSNALTATGGLMPVMGFGMMLVVLGHTNMLPFFIGSFFLCQYTGISGVPLMLIASFCTFIYLLIVQAGGAKQSTENQVTLRELWKQAGEEMKHEERVLTYKDYLKTVWRFNMFVEMSNSFARLQGLAFGAALVPALKKLYKNDPEEYKKALQRHVMFYVSEPHWGGVPIVTTTLMMEEQRSMGEPITEDAIVGFKSGVMGPLAGIGDTINWSTIKPLVNAAMIPIAAAGSGMAEILFILIIGAVTTTEIFVFLKLTYNMGQKAILAILRGGYVQKAISVMTVLGMVMIGGMTATYVSISTPITYLVDGETATIQGLLDSILPGILPFIAVICTYLYLRRGIKGNRSMRMALILSVTGLLLGIIGIIGTRGLVFTGA